MRRVTPRLTMAAVALLLLGGCAPADGRPSPSAPSTGPIGSATPTGRAPGTATPTRPASSLATREPASPTLEPPGSLVGTVVTTLADEGLRVRSQPGLGADSRKEEPLLPLGTDLYVLDGPVSDSGYAWYEAAPLAPNLPSGWVAIADRDGEPWVAAAAFECPPVPEDVRSLAALAPGVGVFCFPRQPITVRARLIECNCDIDGAWYTPDWFFLGSGSPTLLMDPDLPAAPPDVLEWDNWLVLNLDPLGEHPAVLPLGRVVEVTGVFDHPAAADCSLTEMDREPVPSHGCRLSFAVTALDLAGP
jgi:hypothetical protein